MAYDAKSRARARSLYEAGNSFSKIHHKTGITVRSLKDWCKKEGWEKSKSAPILHQKEQDALEAEAERHGVTKARVFAKIGDLMDAKSLAVITTQGAVSLCPTSQEQVSEDGKGRFHGITYDAVDDRKTQIEATKLAADVLGLKKTVVDPGDGFRAFYQGLRRG